LLLVHAFACSVRTIAVRLGRLLIADRNRIGTIVDDA
jgi:hypothetical protein